MTLYEHHGASTMVVLRLQSWLRDWLISHIMNADKQMVASSTRGERERDLTRVQSGTIAPTT